MLIRCSQCGARGKVKSEDPNKAFRCPKCGGAMRAEQAASAAPEPAAPTGRQATERRAKTSRQVGTSRRRTSRISDRRRRRKKFPVVAVALGVLAIVVALGGGYYYYGLINAPGPGAQALSRLPHTTLAAASVENLQELSSRLARLGDSEPHKVSGAVEAYRKWFELQLKNELDAPDYADAVQLLRAAKAAAFGLVPGAREGAPPVTISMLVFDKPHPPSVLLQKIPPAGDISGVRLHRRRGSFCMLLENVLVICKQREPLEAMARSFLVAGNPESLGTVPEFVAARAEFSRRGPAWLYMSGQALEAGKQLGGALAGPEAAQAGGLAPGIQYAVAFVEVSDPAMTMQCKVMMAAGDAYYANLRLKPRALKTPEYMPADSLFAFAIALDQPTVLYDRMVGTLDNRFMQVLGEKLSAKIRRFERAQDRLSIARDVMPLLAGEIGVYRLMPGQGELAGGILIPTIKAAAAEETAKRLVTQLSGAEPKAVRMDGGDAWAAGPIRYRFIDDMLVLGIGPEALKAVAQARDTGQHLAAASVFRTASARLPAESSALLFSRESPGSQMARHAGEQAWCLLASVRMDENDVSIHLAMPSFAQWLMATAPDREGMQPSGPTGPPDRTAQSRASIEALAKICFQYRDRPEGGTLFPEQFADLVRDGHIDFKNMEVLVRPNDLEPRFRVGDVPTSYEVAFGVVPDHRFDKDTPGDVPMVWEGDASHQGKRFVAYFDGSVRLEEVSRAQLIHRIRVAVAKLKGEEPPAGPDGPEEPAEPATPDSTEQHQPPLPNDQP